MNGWLLVRIAGIVVGIATLLRVATNEGIVTYDPLFLAWMDRLRDFVELGFLTDLIGPLLHWGIEQVRNLGISVPNLQDEWRPAFVLSMLIFGARARHSPKWSVLIQAAVGTLIITVWSGLVGSLAPVSAGVLAALCSMIFVAILRAVRFNHSVRTGEFLFDRSYAPKVNIVGFGVLLPVLAIVFAALATFIPTFVVAVVTAAVVATLGTIFVIVAIGAFWDDGWRVIFAKALFNTGIDILFTMSVAFAIAVAVANPPIW
jgi:hypothetical protein